MIQYAGKAYKCLQGHVALLVWTPDIMPALWQETAVCSSSSSSSSSGSGGKGGGSSSSSSSSTSSSSTSSSSSSSSSTSSSSTSPSSSTSASSSSSSSSSASSSGGGGASGGTDYAPYFYTWGWGSSAYPFTSLVDLKNKSGLNGVTLAFVLSSGGCAATGDIQRHQGDVSAFRNAGGKLKASFGGAHGTYLENACPDAASLARALGAFVDQTGISDLDFDVEQGGAMNAATNQKRAAAFKQLQDRKGVKVSFTLAALPRDKWGTPGGVTAPSLDVLEAAVQAGVSISHVNLMAMDYGDSYSGGHTMGDLAVSALTDAKAQLQSLIAGLTDAQAWAMLGATPMIGRNDVSTEVFTLADAQTLATFAKQQHLGLVAFWAINRDQPGSGSLGLYSQAETAVFAFHKVFRTVTQ